MVHLASSDEVSWDWYEEHFEAAYGYVPPTRELVERFRTGDESAANAFESIAVFSDADGGTFARFEGKAKLFFAGDYLGDDPDLIRGEIVRFLDGIRIDFAQQGVEYAEFRGAAAHLAAVHTHPGASCVERVAISLNREDPVPGWEVVKELALGPHGTSLTAIDFCGVEEGYPPKAMASLFADVYRFNAAYPDRALAILYHVGESFGDKSLECAVRWVQEAAELGAHRLGHAISLAVDPQLFGEHTRHESVAERKDQIAYDLKHSEALQRAGVSVDRQALAAELAALTSSSSDARLPVSYDESRLAEVRRRQDFAMGCVRRTGAVVEVCPTSNRRIAGIVDPAQHPVHRFLSNSVPFIVSSDDPGMFGTTLMKELDWVCNHTGGGDDLRQYLVETAWTSRSERITGRVRLGQ